MTEDPEPACVQASLTFDQSVNTWYCLVGVKGLEFDGLGAGPDPLAAALNCVERLYGSWSTLRYPEEPPAMVLTREVGWASIDKDGSFVRSAVE